MNDRGYLLKVPIDMHQPDEFVRRIKKALETPHIKTIIAINPEKIMRAQHDNDLLLALKASDFLIPDGIGATVGIRLIYGKKIARTTGFQLMRRLLELAQKENLGVFIFGADEDVNRLACEKIIGEFPTLRIIGHHHGYLSEDGYEELINKINLLAVDILFVALGSPKQEKWIFNYREKINVRICIGVGGSLDVISGRIPGASKLVGKLGLEWLYRLAVEPLRIKRQVVLPRYVFALIKEKIS